MIEDIKKTLLEGNNKYQWKIIQEEEQLRNNTKPNYPVLILTCIDPRIDIHRIFQLELGDVFVFRNAGNIFTEDILRSVLIVIYEYNIKYIIVLGHLDCGVTKINLSKMRNRLSKPALIKICRNGTNIELNLQKFFKIFTDEIKNINNQVERIKSANEIPSEVQVIGMLYDSKSGWVFESKEFQKYPSVESLMKDYKKIIENKRLKLIDYFESIEDEIIGKNIKESKEILVKTEEENFPLDYTKDYEKKQEKQFDEGVENGESVVNVLTLEQNLIKDYHSVLQPIQKVKIPKIYIPKVNVTIPKIYKTKKK